MDHSLIPIKKAFWALHFWNCFAYLEQLHIAHVANHHFRIVTEWVVDVILLQIGFKCFSMRMTLDLLDELLNAEIFCFFFTTACDNPGTLKSMSISSSWVNKPMDCSLSTGLPVLIWSASTFSPASLSLSTRSTDTGTQLWLNGGPFTGLTVLDNWMFCFWLGLLGVFVTSSNFWTQFFHPIVFKGNLRRRSRWCTYFLVYDFSSFHHDSLRDTIGWECIVKNDGVLSRLIEL